MSVEGFVYSARHKNGHVETLNDLNAVIDLVRYHCAGEQHANGDADDIYDSCRVLLGKRGIMLSRSVAEGFEPVYELYQVETQPSGILFPRKVSVEKLLVKQADNLGGDLWDVYFDLDSECNLSIFKLKHSTVMRGLCIFMDDVHDADKNTYDRVVAHATDIANALGGWDRNCTLLIWNTECVMFPEDPGYQEYQRFRAMQWGFAKSGKYILRRTMRVKRIEYEVSLPINLVHRLENLRGGRELDGDVLEKVLERVLQLNQETILDME